MRSLALDFAKMAPSNTKQSKSAGNKKEHDISDEDLSDDEHEKGDNLSLSDNQMNAVAFLVKSAVSAAVAQMLPLTQQLVNSQNPMGGASDGTSAQGLKGANASNLDQDSLDN